MNFKLKKIFTNVRVIILLVFLVLALVILVSNQAQIKRISVAKRNLFNMHSI